MLTHLIYDNRSPLAAHKCLTNAFTETWYCGCKVRDAHYPSNLSLLLSLFLCNIFKALGGCTAYMGKLSARSPSTDKDMEGLELTTVAMSDYDDFLSVVGQLHHKIIDVFCVIVQTWVSGTRAGMVAGRITRRLKYMDIVTFRL